MNYIPKQAEIYSALMEKYAALSGVSVAELGQEMHVRNTVIAEQIWLLFLKLSRVQENLYPDLAEPDALKRDGLQLLGRLPSLAEAGEYTITVNTQAGAYIPSGTRFISARDSTSPNKVYTNDWAYSVTPDIAEGEEQIDVPQGTIRLRALEAGNNAKLIIGDKLKSTMPLFGCDDIVSVASIHKAPADAENIDSYRDDVLNAKRIYSKVFTHATIRLWCSEIAQIRTVYSYIKANGTLEIYAEATKENSQSVIGEPSQDVIDGIYHFDTVTGEETGVMIYNEETSEPRRPVGVINISAMAAKPVQIGIAFTGLSDTSTNIVEAIKGGVENLVYNIRPFITGSDSVTSRNDRLSIAQLLSVAFTSLSGTGAIFETMQMTSGGDAISDITFKYGDYPYLKSITNNGIVLYDN